MDGFEKLLLTNSLISSTNNDNKAYIYGFITGFMSCIIILMFIMTCYNTFKDIVNHNSIMPNHAYSIPRQSLPSVPLNVTQDMERYINYYY